METVRDFVFWGLQNTAEDDCSHVKKWDISANKGPSSQSYGFTCSHVWMLELNCKQAECWRIDAFELCCWRRPLRVPWTARRSYQSILKEISPEYSLEGLMLKLKLQYFGHLMQRTDSLEKTLLLGKNKVALKGDVRGSNHWITSLTWKCVWESLGVGGGQGSLACFHGVTKSWLQLNNWTELIVIFNTLVFYP